MKNKTLFVLFTLLIVAVLALALVACQPTDNPNNGDDDDDSFGKPTKSLVYELNNDGTGYCVSSIPRDDCPTEIVIASTHNKLPVVGIGEWAFKNNTVIESVKIPGSISFIESSAFEGCVNLKNVTIAKNSNLKTIYGTSFTGALGAFANCTSLENINLPEGLTDIKKGAFSGCTSLKNIVIPESVTSIGDVAFSGCTNLESIDLPDSLTDLGEEIFDQCAKLQSLTIPKNVTKVCNLFSYHFKGNLVTLNWNATNAIISLDDFEDAFSPDTLTTVNIGDDVEVLPEEFLSGYRNLTTVNFGANSKLKTIGRKAFNWCTSLTNVTLPSSLTEIGAYAFSGCENAFTELTFQQNVTVDNNAFYCCKNITKITAPYVVARSIAIDCESTALDLVITDFDNVNVADYRYKHLANVKNVIIDDSVTAICDYAFSSCENLVSVTFGENSKLESIGSYAFAECTALLTITLPNGLQTIESEAFQNCTALTNVTLPSSLTEIEYYAFSGCENAFTELTFNENASVSGNAFEDCTSITKITASAEVASAVGIACGSDEFEVVITSGDTVEAFSKYGGSKYVSANVSKVTIPSSVTAIGGQAFTNCTTLKDVVIAEDTKFSVGADAFSGCTGLTQESLQSIINSTTSIGSNSFAKINCEELTIPEDLKYNNSNAPFSVATITKLICSAEWANVILSVSHASCDELVVTSGTSINVSYSTIKKVTLPDTLKTIGSFESCKNLTSITVPEGVTTIGKEAFSLCSSLTTINLPSTITQIEDYIIYQSWSVLTINYNGTKADWKKINRGDHWNDNVSQSMKVYCTDGYLIKGIS